MNQAFFHAWKAFVRDLRAGELKLLMFAVILAVAALCAVGFFAGRLEAALKRDAAQLLGGDAVIASDKTLPADFLAEAAARRLQTTLNANFPSMALGAEPGNEEARLVGLKVVADGYPLRGYLKLKQGAADVPAGGVPPSGQVWVDPALLSALKLNVGDRIKLGNVVFKATAEIAQESDRGAGFMNFAPRAMINSVDLAATGLVQPASRITYRLVVAGERNAVRTYVAWAEAQVKSGAVRGVRVESLESGRPEMRQTLDRAESFLRLVALLAAMLAAVAVAIAARRFAERKVDACALMRVMGAPQRLIAWSFALEFLLTGLLAGVIGVAIGFGAHFAFAQLLAGLVEGQLPPVDWSFALLGLAAGLTLLAAFGLPPVLNLARVPALRVIRRDVGGLRIGALAVGLASLIGFSGLLVLMAKDIKLGLIASLGFFAAWALFAAAGYGSARAARVWARSNTMGAAITLAAKQIASRAAQTGVQVAALGVGLLALLLLFTLRTDLVDSWRAATPPDAPDRFVINIQPDQASAFQAQLVASKVGKYDWFPMIRGRLTAVNGKAVTPEDYKEDRAKRLVDREFNLSSSDTLPAHNLVSSGSWYQATAQEMSVEEGLAQTLGLKLGDSLSFDMGGQSVSAKITSLRKVDWGSMRVNFFVLLPTALMKDAPTTFVTAFKAPQSASNRALDNQLSREFPNVTVVDVSASIAQLQKVLDQVIRAVEFLFLFAVACGLLVLVAALRASEGERARFIAILRALGGARSLLSKALAAELILIGLLAGLLASIAAGAIGWALARYVFEFEWRVSPWLPLAGAALGATLAWGAGWWQMRALLNTPVNQTLREAM